MSTSPPPPPSPPRSAPADRARRAFETCLDLHGDTDPLVRRLATALDRHGRPFDLRVVGGLGSGRHAVADALAALRPWRPTVEDIDELVADPGAPPDAEIQCLCTAPCRHEDLWRSRPRRHPLFVLATFGTRHGSTPPEWARGLPVVSASAPEPDVVAELSETLDVVARDLPRHRDRALADTLAELAAHPSLTEIIEPALSSGRTAGGP